MKRQIQRSMMLCPVAAVMFTGCVKLDLKPLYQATDDDWYSSETEIEMSANDLWRVAFFPIDDERWDDDITSRSGVQEIKAGTGTAQSSWASERWLSEYKAITRSRKILKSIQEGRAQISTEEKRRQYEGEALFMQGFAYAELATYFGDCVLDTVGISLQEAYKSKRAPKEEVLKYAYRCLDSAAVRLPASYSGQQRPTSGAALGFKARFALFHGDWKIAADAAKKVMDSGLYKLHDSYPALFATAQSSKELLFYFKGSEYSAPGLIGRVSEFTIRKMNGFISESPSYSLLCSYLCTDGKPIDESPLYNPKDPFSNRDPRLGMTIQPFKTKWAPDYADYERSKTDGTFGSKYKAYTLLGYEYSPSPYATKIYSLKTKEMVANPDSKATHEHASYNGLAMRKFVNDDWAGAADKYYKSDNLFPYLRYAEILLTYLEAENELGPCGQDILDKTINKVRERAYRGSGLSYPKVTETSQESLRKIIKMERRMEFPFEGVRYRDLLRWKIAETAFNMPEYYLSRSWSGSKEWNGSVEESNVKLSEGFRELLVNWDEGNFPIGGIFDKSRNFNYIDDDGIPHIGYMEQQGYISVYYQCTFDRHKNYLWPIPASDKLVNPDIMQNPGY